MELLYACGLALAFTVVIAVIELVSKSKSRVPIGLVSSEFLVYLMILIVGNIATTMAASGVGVTLATAEAEPGGADVEPAESRIDSERSIPGPMWFWYAFVGVFGFEVVLQNLNITFASRGVLTISDWISKARDQAVAEAIKRQTDAIAATAQRLASRLQTLPAADLNAHVLQLLGAQRLQEIETAAQQSGANASLAKGLALAYAAPVDAAAIL
jgi:hypothetical protein